MTYNIITIGCQMNRADSERLSFYLQELGFKTESNFLKADLVILVTCGVKQAAEDRVYGLVGQILKKNKKGLVAITGCLSERSDVHHRLPKVKIWFNISDFVGLQKVLKKYFVEIKKMSEIKIKKYLDIPADYSSTFSAFVPIGNGCNNFCSYCVVPYARGREVYRSSRDIIKEVKMLLNKGYKEITLIAQNVNSYKSDMDFPTLLKTIDDLPGDFWLRFSTSHPKDVSSKLIKVLKSGRHICEHYHLAVQSGDDDILRAMNRKYKVAQYKKVVKNIRQALDYKNGLPTAITTDVIVGFPGETKKNFLNTKKLLREEKFDLIFISQYSPRYQTVSYQMIDDVSPVEKKTREVELNDLLKKIALKNNKKYLNKDVEVLIGGVNRRGELFGRTRTAKLVRIKNKINQNRQNVCGNRDLVGQFAKVRIIKALEFELQGELILNKKDDN
jgi:tRNA-2-methylthio-N6-dimethylallyladenosine synthase